MSRFDDYLEAMGRLDMTGDKDSWVGDWLIRRVWRTERVSFTADHVDGISVNARPSMLDVARLMENVDAGMAGVER